MQDPTYVQWLIERSMLHSAQVLARDYSGRGEMWLYPYAETQPRAASARASVWLAAYPPSIVTRPGESVLGTLGDPALWETLAAIGVKAVHTGPMKRSGGIRGRDATPSVDGNFDRISTAIDPQFGSVQEFVRMSANARAAGAIVIDDIIPGHTGKGADFRLAELGYGDYPGLYHMVEIRPEDWNLLPPVEEGRDSANLSELAVDALSELGYIVGRLSRTIFYAPGIKDTDWSATGVVTGVDGRGHQDVGLLPGEGHGLRLRRVRHPDADVGRTALVPRAGDGQPDQGQPRVTACHLAGDRCGHGRCSARLAGRDVAGTDIALQIHVRHHQ